MSDYQHGCGINDHLEGFTILFDRRIPTSESGNRLSYFEKDVGKKLENSLGISGKSRRHSGDYVPHGCYNQAYF